MHALIDGFRPGLSWRLPEDWSHTTTFLAGNCKGDSRAPSLLQQRPKGGSGNCQIPQCTITGLCPENEIYPCIYRSLTCSRASIGDAAAHTRWRPHPSGDRASAMPRCQECGASRAFFPNSPDSSPCSVGSNDRLPVTFGPNRAFVVKPKRSAVAMQPKHSYSSHPQIYSSFLTNREWR